MKVSFILTHSTTRHATIYDKSSWPERDYTLEKNIAANTNFLIGQLLSIPIEKEILVMDNTGDFVCEYTDPCLHIVKSFAYIFETTGLVDLEKFKFVKDKISLTLDTSNATECASMAFNHGLTLATGDYIVMQHNDTRYLFDYYPKETVIYDAITLLEENSFEYITVDAKTVKNRGYDLWREDIKYYTDCYWFLCKADFYKKHEIWVDWTRGDTNHLATITCIHKNLPFLHLPGHYEGPEIRKMFNTQEWIDEESKKYPNLYKIPGRIHNLNNIPFLYHAKGGTGLKSLNLFYGAIDKWGQLDTR